LTFPSGLVNQGGMRLISFFRAGLVLIVSCWSLAAAEAPESFKAGEFSFKPPAGWTWVKTSSQMRAAQLEVGQGEGKAEVVFFYFGPSSAGGTQANVARWLSQFKEPKDQLKSQVDEMKIGKRKTTLVQAEGTYMSGRPGGPKTERPGSMLLGAIMESSQGHVYVRMVGSKETVLKATPAFKKMVEMAMGGG